MKAIYLILVNPGPGEEGGLGLSGMLVRGRGGGYV